MNSLGKRHRWIVFVFLMAAFLLGKPLDALGASVEVLRVPNGGIQPQAAMDELGNLHLIYFKGAAGNGDLFYVRRDSGKTNFSHPIQVNSEPGCAVAAGTIRGAQMALGQKGRMHVGWNGTTPKGSDHMKAPMLYTRMNEAGTAFEPQKNVITKAWGLDGGGSVAADREGNVFVFWHASKAGDTNGESGRALFVAKSTDEGETFSPEKMAIEKATGACACCGMKAFANRSGHLFALYRSASTVMDRDEVLLVSSNRGESFAQVFSHPWRVAACPMSSASISEGGAGVVAAWETDGKVYFAKVDSAGSKVSEPITPPGEARRKHPVAVSNPNGDILLTWTEGTSWAKGGAVLWQIFKENGTPVAEPVRLEGLPAWSLAAALAAKDHAFILIY
jgi:hypothetical protein